MGESEEERRRRLNRERSQRWRDNHPGAGAAASQRHREKYGNAPWPAKRNTGLRVKMYKEETPCTDCGQKFPACCMDFDHMPGHEKALAVGTLVAHGYSWAVIEAEIAKCELVCANCHRIRTRDRRTKVDRIPTL